MQLLKPAFTIIHDKGSKCFLLLIRGTHSIKDTLTAATGAVVPFHHSVLHDGGVSNLVLGYAHCGMVAAARWIAKLCAPCLLKALDEHPDHNVKVSAICILYEMQLYHIILYLFSSAFLYILLYHLHVNFMDFVWMSSGKVLSEYKS